MHTEDEARKKTCPFHAAGSIVAATLNDKPEAPDLIASVTRCIASTCAMWRWEFVSNDPAAERTEHARGFCGLAGRP